MGEDRTERRKQERENMRNPTKRSKKGNYIMPAFLVVVTAVIAAVMVSGGSQPHQGHDHETESSTESTESRKSATAATDNCAPNDGHACCKVIDENLKTPAKVAAGKQTATVRIGQGYSPSIVVLKQGVPAEITFKKEKTEECGGTLTIPQIGLEKHLHAGESAVAKFTPSVAENIDAKCCTQEPMLRIQIEPA